MSDGSILESKVLTIRSIFQNRGVLLREILRLRFRDPEVEAGFSKYYGPICASQCRSAFSLGIFLLLGDYVADSMYYGTGGEYPNLLRVTLLILMCVLFVAMSYTKIANYDFELFVSIFYIVIANVILYTLYLIDISGGNGISGVVGILNIMILLVFGYLLSGTRLYYSVASCILACISYMFFLKLKVGDSNIFYYYLYQVMSVLVFCTLLGYMREFLLRADFATQLELSSARESRSKIDLQHLDWLRQLAAFLRHEVRQPVAQINSSLELIQLTGSEKKQDDHVFNATRSVQHVWNLIDRATRATDAVTFVRQSTAQVIDVSALVEQMVQKYSQTSSEVYFSLKIPGKVSVNADPALVEEAVGNIINNAISFADDESTIDVSLVSQGSTAAVSVVNKGPLLDVDPKACFEQFSSTRSDAGSEHHGLGLYLVRLIAQHYDGKAYLRNLSDGSGVSATIELPLHQPKL